MSGSIPRGRTTSKVGGDDPLEPGGRVRRAPASACQMLMHGEQAGISAGRFDGCHQWSTTAPLALLGGLQRSTWGAAQALASSTESHLEICRLTKNIPRLLPHLSFKLDLLVQIPACREHERPPHKPAQKRALAIHGCGGNTFWVPVRTSTVARHPRRGLGGTTRTARFPTPPAGSTCFFRAIIFAIERKQDMTALVLCLGWGSTSI
mmetsp:Transcript_138497/g.386347  ORF Transcript_138497/g.386347 Transcript_138497/m.386347 type:complete len:207 (-) Transcript_138497:20-640(-)